MTGSGVVAPYGSWPSPVSAASLAGDRVILDQTALAAGHLYWLEGRGAEGGRVVLVRDGVDLAPPPFNVRSRVHEYGGGAYTVAGDMVVFVDLSDQRLRALSVSGGSVPPPITPDTGGQVRYADLRVDRGRRRVYCVREDHRDGGEPRNTIVGLSLDGPNGNGGQVLVQGPDFVAAPRLSPDGSTLAWLQWHHPNMPWDSTELWAGSLDVEGVLVSAGRLAGGAGVAVTEPRWGPDGALFYLSDETGWANLAVLRPGRPARVLVEMYLEFGWPQPVFDRPSFGVTDDGIVVCAWLEHGSGRLATVAPDGRFTALQVEGTAFDHVRVEGRTVVALVDYVDRARALVKIDLDRGTATTVRQESTLDLPAGLVPYPEAVSWTNSRGQDVHGFFYAPTNAGYRAPEGELPPLIVRPHSGPTAMSTPSFNLDTVYWTSRGLAVLDVNYGGSTGYGRAYRERLRGNWGVIDVDDCATGARALALQGRVDGGRLAIRGASAGGFTALAALTGTDVFAAGASRFGVGDLESLARDTHKFESRYLDGLVAPYPEGRDIYRQRSPLHHLDALNAPMILLQGLDDTVVPPSQARDMADAVRAKGLPVAHLEFAGEGHGFRKSETIIRSREAEAYFYSRVFGYDLADDIQPIPIDNV